MTEPVALRPSGFNYGYRPASYFEFLDPEALIVASILGEERRKDVKARLASGDFDPVVWGEWITESKLDDATRRVIGSFHPSFMGGEYLPALGEDEIEIARIVFASTLQDVTSIRARRAGKRIAYRIVDDNEAEYKACRKWSSSPLTLEELIGLINGSNHKDDHWTYGLAFSNIMSNLFDAGSHPDDMRGFVAVSSSFYPELERFFSETIDLYLDECLAEIETEEEEEEEEEAS